MTQRVGLLGGTFDPVHKGHLQVASEAKKKLQLDAMYLLPLSTPVHKQAPVASDQQRLQCLRLALKSYPDLQIETAELDRAGDSYTVDTLQHLCRQKPGMQLYWLMGVDAFNYFDNWKQPDKILRLANLVVINRPGSQLSEAVITKYQQHFCQPEDSKVKKVGNIIHIELPAIDISSTELRALLADGVEHKATKMIPELVLEYIRQENIYLNKRETMNVEEIKDQIVDALEDIKGIDITVLSVGEMTSVADYLIVASGGSNRQVKALADSVQMRLKKKDVRPLGVEGEREAQWILIDYGDILVHIMMPETRDFYNLEKLWEERPQNADSSTD